MDAGGGYGRHTHNSMGAVVAVGVILEAAVVIRIALHRMQLPRRVDLPAHPSKKTEWIGVGVHEKR